MTLDVMRARLLLGVLMVATFVVALRYYDGHDFVNNVYTPIHGLIAGYNPYDPAGIEYYLRYKVPVVAGLYLPTALFVHAPLALLSQSNSASAIAAIDVAMIWLGVLLLTFPRTFRGYLVAGAAGTLLVLSAPAQDTIFLGQLSGEAFAGLALVVASLRRDVSAKWLPAVGVTMVALKPQSAIPIFVALAVLQYWQVLARAAAIIAVTSVPGTLLFLRAAGSPSAIMRTVTGNLSHLSQLPPNDLTFPGNVRIDALGVLSHLGGPALTGLGWTGIIFAVATGILVLALRAIPRDARTLADPYVVSIVTLYVIGSLVHLSYDQLTFYVGPLTAVGVIIVSKAPSRRVRLIATGGAALAASGIIFRSGFRSRLIHSGRVFPPVHQAWLALPTLIVLAIVGCVQLVELHTVAPEPAWPD
jgi:hypothetical protein